MSKRKKIVIIGGGITGLTTAYYWQQKVNDEQLPYDIQLIEASDRLGGKIRTYKQDGFTIERGPDSFLARKEPGIRLAKSLGIEQDRKSTRLNSSHVAISYAVFCLKKKTTIQHESERRQREHATKRVCENN